MARKKGRSPTARDGIMAALQAAPPGASLTREELIRASGRARETARIQLGSMVADGVVEKIHTDGGNVYRAPRHSAPRQDTPTFPASTAPADLVGSLRSAYEARWKAELRIQVLETQIRENLEK